MEEIAELESSDARLLPYRPAMDAPDPEIEILPIDEAGTVIDVLSSATARAILSAVYADASPTSEIADRVDTSIQNTAYHLSRLADVGLVSTAGTWYSSKGASMDVYVPAVDPLVLVAASPENPVADVLGRLEVEEQSRRLCDHSDGS